MIEAKTLAELEGVRHGFFTRQGGVSTGVYDSLNCGTGSKDDPLLVARNRERVAAGLGVAVDRLVTPYQTHSPTAVVATSSWERADAPKADAVVTKEPGLAVGVLTADCAPVLLAEPDSDVVAAAHAGWRGALTGVLEQTVALMEELGAERTRIVAVVGPAISQDAYEVGEDFKETFLEASDANASYFSRPDPNRKPYFDLIGYAADRLRGAGLTRIDAVQQCTYGNETELFSYRRACHRSEPDYGRQISAIVLA
ncbi:MAG: peptidoglycan editing factor PgeF [Methyloligellaceae bacterium]